MTGNDRERTGDGAADAADTAERFVLGDGAAVAPPETWGVDIETLCSGDANVTGQESVATLIADRPEEPPTPSLNGEWVTHSITVAHAATEPDRSETARPPREGTDSPFARPTETIDRPGVDRLPRVPTERTVAEEAETQSQPDGQGQPTSGDRP